MGTPYKRWVRKSIPCKKCGKSPTVKTNGKEWAVACLRCNPEYKHIFPMDETIIRQSAMAAVLAWNVRNSMSLRQEIAKGKRQLALARIEALDTEHIGMIDGSAYAEKIKKLARRFADLPLNKEFMYIDTVIHLLDNLV